MEGREPSGFEDTGESGEAYEVEIISEIYRRQERRVSGRETPIIVVP
jgi:hypothetical protein